MARQLMPKSGVMMPYVVISRDAAVVGVSTVDGKAGAIDLTTTYRTITDSYSKAQTYTKTEVDNLISPIMTGALFKADPFVNNNVPFRSGGANGVTSINLIKASSDNSVHIGDSASGVQGVHIFSEGRIDVTYKNDSGVATVAPLYSKRYRPEVADMPFAAIGDYVKDSAGRTISVNRTGVNSDIKQLTALTNIGSKVVFAQSPTVPDPVNSSDVSNKNYIDTSIANLSSVKGQWSVINTDATTPVNGTTVLGGSVKSEYKIGTTTEVVASMQSKKDIGASGSGGIIFSVDDKGQSSQWHLAGAGGQINTTATTGWATNTSMQAPNNANDIRLNGIYAAPGSASVNYGYNFAALLHIGRYDTSTQSQLQINGDATIKIRGSNSVSAAWNSWVTLQAQGTSGREFKRDITPADPKEALARINSQDLVTFVYKDDEQERVRFGVIAEDAEKIAPQYVKHDEETVEIDGKVITRDHPRIDINPIVMDLMGCIQALKAEVDNLKKEISELKK